MRLARLFLVPVLATLSLAAQESALSGTWTQTKADDIAAAINLTVADMNLMGNYGVGIHFSDGHTTGIFRFRELRRAR